MKKKERKTIYFPTSIQIGSLDFCGFSCILYARLCIREFLFLCYFLFLFLPFDDSIFFSRISSPCVLCVCVTELPRFRRWLFLWESHQPFSSFVCLVCLPFCLLIEVIYSNRMYLSACADGDMSVAHGGHSSLITFLFFWFLFFQCVNRPVRSVVVWFLFHFVFLFLILFLFIQFISFLLMLSGRFDTAGRDYGLKKKLSGLWGLSFLDYFSCCS